MSGEVYAWAVSVEGHLSADIACHAPVYDAHAYDAHAYDAHAYDAHAYASPSSLS